MKKNSSLLVWFIHSSPLILKTILLGLFGILLYGSYTFLTSDPPGYCGEQKRFLSDEEFIEIAVRSLVSRMNIDESEESIRTFHAMHPGCCDVGRGDSRNLLGKVFGARYTVNVQVVHEVNENESKRTRAKFYEHYLPIDACGHRHGERISSSLNESEYNTLINWGKQGD